MLTGAQFGRTARGAIEQSRLSQNRMEEGHILGGISP
jgi:hypothetical protein